MRPHHQPQPIASTSHSTMESLALPEELYWDGKSEPISPPCSELFAMATDLVEPEDWLYDDNFANEILLDLELKPGEEIMHDLVESDELVIELCDLKEENWPPQAGELETQIPAYSELDNIIATQQNPHTKIASSSTPYDVTFYGPDALETSSLTNLTPPQSPPHNSILSIIQQQQQQQQHDTAPLQLHTLHYRPVAATDPTAAYIIPTVPTELHPININAAPFTTNVQNVAVKNELEQAQLVDQIIEELAKDLPDMSDEYESQYTYSPPSQIEESTTDEEWTPSNSANSSPTHYNSSSSSSSSCSGDEKHSNQIEKTNSSTKKRRPYGRGVEDRKIRKKEQNKNAATRYRQKKKIEMELVLDEEQKLTQCNEELKGKLGKCLREMKYLKSLIREFYGKKE